MGGRSSVVAVGVQGDVIAWWTACVHGRTGAIAVFIGIGVERQQDAFVHEAVAVVVAAIADFGGRGVDPRSGVITVGPAGAVARAVDVAAERVGLPVEVRVAEAKGAGVAVFVRIAHIADLRVARKAAGVRVVAVGPATSDALHTITIHVAVRAAARRAAPERVVARLPVGTGQCAGRDAASRVRVRRARPAVFDPVAEDTIVAVRRGGTGAPSVGRARVRRLATRRERERRG
jgi:hypothetical protein